MILDLYCCEGGASEGYRRAGFGVFGNDLDPQPRYPFPFAQGDALEVLRTLLGGDAVTFVQPNGVPVFAFLDDFAAIHASPPCQRRTRAQKIRGNDHPALIAPTRELLQQTGLPWVIENVVGDGDDDDPLVEPIMLCGAMFDLETYRHRLFESNVAIPQPPHPEHVAPNTKMGRPPVAGEFMHIVGNFSGVDRARGVMQMPWASRDGLREAIPPAFAEWVGASLMSSLSVQHGA